jgi:hypothetical protein
MALPTSRDQHMITKNYLRLHPDHVFVFGDNVYHKGYGGAAALRDEPNTYGFLTKKLPANDNASFYTCDEYKEVYNYEILKLTCEIAHNSDKTYLISKVGAGLANRYHIWEEIIEPNIKRDLSMLLNVKFLW